MPSLDAFEVAGAFPVGDAVVEGFGFEPSRVDIVSDHFGAEGAPGERAAFEEVGGLFQRRGERGKPGIGVGVAGVDVARVEVLSDASHARRESGGEGQVRIGIRAGHPVLDAEGVAVADDAEADGAVVVGPGEFGGGPTAGLVTFVSVNGRRKEVTELARVFNEPAKKLAKEARTGLALRVPEKVAATAPKAGVNMATVAGLGHGGLGHEGDRAAVLRRDLLDALLEDGVDVRQFERRAVGEVNLVLSPAPLTLAGLDRHARVTHQIANGAKERLVPRRLHGVVIDAVIARGRKVAITGSKRVGIGVVVEKKLELTGNGAGELLTGERVNLGAQERARGFGHRLATIMTEVADDQGSAGLPGDGTDGGEVRTHLEVTEAGVPIGDAVAVHGLHLDVDGEEVVAAMGSLLGHLIEEERCDEAFTDEPADHVRDGDNNRIDRAGFDF